MAGKKNLDDIRVALDGVDRRLIDALAERQSLILEVGRTKAGGVAFIRDAKREEDLLGRLVDVGRDAGLDTSYVTRLFREILDHSVRMQQELISDHQDPARERVLRVGYQGGEGAFSHMAAMRHFGVRDADVGYRGFESFRALLEAVKDDLIDYAVLPIENTTAGSINESYDLLARMDLALVGEEIQRVEHCLVALEEVPLPHIRRVYSHPQALAQCADFLGSLKNCHAEAYKDTALAVAKIKEDQDLSQAAIASEAAARLHGLPILKRDIANQRENYTRMVIVANAQASYDQRIPCKTSLIFATRHEEGALARGIQVLADHALNLTKLESRPRPHAPWEYLFYVDFEGNLADPKVPEALTHLAKHTSYLKVLGSYPSRTTKGAKPADPKRRKRSDSLPSPIPEIVPTLEKKRYRLASRAHRTTDTIITAGGVPIGGSPPVLIAGPHAVESRENIRQIARLVADAGGRILFGGCFTPRSGPDLFDGLGYEGLDLLAAAGREHGLPVMTEVFHPADVPEVARRAELLRIPGRHMEDFPLLEEVGKVDRAVFLERAPTATIDEWLEAAEYVLAHGNQQVVLCETGIRTFEDATRSTLDLSCIPVIRERSHLPIVVDPGKATGQARWVSALADAAIAAGAHGVVVEVHPTPRTSIGNALDPEQLDRLADRILP